MQMRILNSTNLKGFTLVELIVVITILAILATVAFVSLSGQTGNAKNTVKRDSIAKLSIAIENSSTNGINLASFLENSNNKLTVGMIGGDVVTGSNIDAGDINYSALDLKVDDFTDEGSPYKYGYTLVKGGKFEVAGNLINGELTTSYLAGNYEARGVLSVPVTMTASNRLKLDNRGDINVFSIGDYLSDGSNIARVVEVSDDMQTLTVNANMVSGNIGLSTSPSVSTIMPEVSGLIGVIGDLSIPITQHLAIPSNE